MSDWSDKLTGTYGSTSKPIDYKISTEKAAADATDNFNTYGGNLSVYFGDFYSGIGWDPGARVNFKNSSNYGAISLRMKFSYDCTYSFGVHQTEKSLYAAIATQGYRIQLQRGSMLGIKKVVNATEKWMPYTYILNGVSAEVADAKYCEMGALEDTVWTVSYGIYPTVYNGQEANAIWISFLTGEGKTLEAIAYDVDPSTVDYGTTGLTENHNFMVGVCRIFVQQNFGIISAHEEPPVNGKYRRRFAVEGLNNATIYYFPEQYCKKVKYIAITPQPDSTPILDETWEEFYDPVYGQGFKGVNKNGKLAFLMPYEKYL